MVEDFLTSDRLGDAAHNLLQSACYLGRQLIQGKHLLVSRCAHASMPTPSQGTSRREMRTKSVYAAILALEVRGGQEHTNLE
jgi:hypothetical protein